ncbi:hypothetical protein, partial [Kaarinaea lacus]
MKNHYYRYAVLIGVLLLFSNLSAQGQSRWQAPMLLEGATKVSAEELVDLIAEFDNIAIIDSRP